MDELSTALTAPVPAIPVDLVRIMAGLVLLWYFSRRFRQAQDFSAHDGLIDHRLCLRIFPPTRMGLFHPGVPAQVIHGALLLACAAAVCISAGYHPRIAAAICFAVAVSAYRWNLLVVYIDDAIMHLLCVWLLLLPVGETLTLSGWLGGASAREAWLDVVVPGGAVRAFMANMAMVYLIAGAYKFTSPMWRNGRALNAILKMPIALRPDYWQPKHGPLLRSATYAALILEPLFALIFILPAHHPFKWFLVLGTAGFHLGIIGTMKIPFANAGMLGALPLALSPEIMLLLGRAPTAAGAGPGAGWPDLLGLSLVVALLLMVIWEVGKSAMEGRVRLWKTHVGGFLGNPMCVLLWMFGIAQSFRLFDWIDDRNWHVEFEIIPAVGNQRAVDGDLDPDALFPKTLRHLFLQSYLIGNVWLRLPADHLGMVQQSLLERHAARYAKAHPDVGTLDVYMTSQQITSDNLALTRGQRSHLMTFATSAGHATVLKTMVG